MVPTVFIGYSHRDKRWKERLVRQLSVLEREGLLAIWDDALIQAGDDWLPAIEAAIAEARVAVIMVSADFLDSEFVRSREVPALMERRRREGLRVIPLIARPCPWQSVPWLAAIQARPSGGKTLAGLGGARAEQVLADLAQEILTLVDTMPRTPLQLQPIAPGTALDEPAPAEVHPASGVAHQHAISTGQGSVIVQIAGSGSTVSVTPPAAPVDGARDTRPLPRPR